MRTTLSGMEGAFAPLLVLQRVAVEGDEQLALGPPPLGSAPTGQILNKGLVFQPRLPDNHWLDDWTKIDLNSIFPHRKYHNIVLKVRYPKKHGIDIDISLFQLAGVCWDLGRDPSCQGVRRRVQTHRTEVYWRQAWEGEEVVSFIVQHRAEWWRFI